jgi:hypothetical protein
MAFDLAGADTSLSNLLIHPMFRVSPEGRFWKGIHPAFALDR